MSGANDSVGTVLALNVWNLAEGSFANLGIYNNIHTLCCNHSYLLHLISRNTMSGIHLFRQKLDSYDTSFINQTVANLDWKMSDSSKTKEVVPCLGK